MFKDFILASSSPRRLELLSQIGAIPDKVIPADIDESRHNQEPLRQYVMRMAYTKAIKVAESNPRSRILAADTIVSCGSRLLFKTRKPEQAEMNLRLLSGRRHKVLGGVCLLTPGGGKGLKFVETTVKFKRLTEEEIKRYLASMEWEGKAGSYAIQGYGATFVSYISGSYSNVVGLPLFETAKLFNGVNDGSSS